MIGTPVTPAVAANSLIVSNVTASGDILFAVNTGGHSQGLIFLDGSLGTLNFPLGFTLGGVVSGVSTANYFDAGAGDMQINSTSAHNGLKIKGSSSDYGPGLKFYHDHATPDVGNYIGLIERWGYDGAGAANFSWGRQYLEYVNVGDGTEESRYVWRTTYSGALNIAMYLSGAGGLTVDADVGTADDPVGLFDEYDDAVALRQGIQQRNHDLLVSMGVFTKKDTGSGYMMNLQPMVRLLAGGIYQTRQMFEDKIAELEDRLTMAGIN